MPHVNVVSSQCTGRKVSGHSGFPHSVVTHRMSSLSRSMPENATPLIILGADAVLAALPASPVQLAHACQALGFQLAAPATWGDELIAESCLDRLATYEHPAAVMCSCPLVTERLTRASMMLEPFMLASGCDRALHPRRVQRTGAPHHVCGRVPGRR